jgi:hypothetical protein
MDVGYQLPQIPLFLAQNGFIPILEKMPLAPMAPVEAQRVAGQKTAHDRRDRRTSGTQQQVGVVAHQRPGIAGCLAPQQQIGQALQKILPIAVIQKNIGSLDAPDDQMVQGAGRIYARLPWHGPLLPELRQYVNNETTSPYFLLPPGSTSDRRTSRISARPLLPRVIFSTSVAPKETPVSTWSGVKLKTGSA